MSLLTRQFFRRSFFIIINVITISTICSPLELDKLSKFIYQEEVHTFNKAAVSTFTEECAEIGVLILKQGGSAVDSAIATTLCEGVANPWAMGLGGGFIMTLHDAETGITTVVDAKETAPSAASKNMFKEYKTKRPPRGLLVATPGQLKGYWEVHQKYGRLPWKSLFKPTISLCKRGVRVSHNFGEKLIINEEIVYNESSLNKLFINPQTNRVYKKDDIVKYPELGKILNRLATDSDPVKLFYEGDVAADIIKGISSYGGIMTLKDLSNYEVKWRDPVVTSIHNFSMYTVPPPGSGALLGLILNVFDGYEKVTDSKFWQRVVENFKWAFAKRTSMGDMDFIKGLDKDIQYVMSKEYAGKIRRNIDDNTTHTNPRFYGAKYSYSPDRGTLHTSVLDRNGSAVSITSSLNDYFGAQFVSSGITFNSHMDDFSTKNIINLYGLRPSIYNYIRPFKRPMSSMAPSILLDSENRVRMILGASGGPRILTALAQFILLYFKDNYNMVHAMRARRLHHQLMPMEVVVEEHFPKDVKSYLMKVGHDVRETAKAIGIITAIEKNRNGKITAYSDPRLGELNNAAGF